MRGFTSRIVEKMKETDLKPIITMIYEILLVIDIIIRITKKR